MVVYVAKEQRPGDSQPLEYWYVRPAVEEAPEGAVVVAWVGPVNQVTVRP